MTDERYDVRYALYCDGAILFEFSFRNNIPKAIAYEIGKGLGEALHLKQNQSEHDLSVVGATYGWMTIMPDEMDEYISVTPSRTSSKN